MSSQKPAILSIVFSFRNEEDVLAELIQRVRTVLQQEINKGTLVEYELIFVDDSSTDRSYEILVDQASAQQDIRILLMSRPFGVSPCAIAGMECARGDAVVYMDADLQDPPELIPELISAWQKGEDIDVVHTIRLSREGESRIKMFITRVGYWILNRTTEFSLPQNAGDFKLLSRRVVDHLVQLRERNPFLRGLVCWVGFNQAYVKYHRKKRAAGKAKFPVLGRKVIWNFLDSALISFSNLPLKIALFVGCIVSVLAFLFLVYFVIQKVVLPYVTPGISVIMVTVLLLGGVQLVTIGLLGLYLSSVFLEAKGRPNYIIKETFGFEQRKKNKG
ncbi:MAG: glycosyltransferase family 2 protein [Candidatus Omnitrophica bacterium]|nr:glycosyltransferase family 2 protein [Candidatus Omnitrophota bacterium]